MARGRSGSNKESGSSSRDLTPREVFGPKVVKEGAHLLTPRPDAFTGVVQDQRTFFTTYQFAKLLRMSPAQVQRWCRTWFGELPPARQTGKGMGYRIPREYLRVARGWMQSQDPRLRETMRKAIVDAPNRDYVVVVGNLGSTHYTYLEAMARLESVLPRLPQKSQVVSLIYVGPTQGSAGN